MSFDQRERAVIARYLDAVKTALRETIDEWHNA
jgi:hypothetical protein